MTLSGSRVRARHRCPLEAIVLLAVATAAGCASETKTARDEVTRRVRTTVDARTGELSGVSYDGDADGRPEAHAFLEDGQAARIEVDRNGDGRTDRWEYYRPAVTADVTPTSPRRPTSNIPPESLLLRIETDTDGDGRPDRWESYSAGTLAAVSMDLKRRGKPDHRLVYDPTGRVTRIETDPDGDGVFVVSSQIR